MGARDITGEAARAISQDFFIKRISQSFAWGLISQENYMSPIENVSTKQNQNDTISLDELITLYKSTIVKLEACARYSPSEDLEQNLQNSNTEVSQFLLQEKIMDSILDRPLSKISDIRKILGFWKLCALGHKKTVEYTYSDHLILNVLTYMKAAKL